MIIEDVADNEYVFPYYVITLIHINVEKWSFPYPVNLI
jgi:hypothetical protein